MTGNEAETCNGVESYQKKRTAHALSGVWATGPYAPRTSRWLSVGAVVAMTLPLFQFRDRLGEPVNLSTAEAREEITKAELYHIVDVSEGLWCRRTTFGC